MLRFILCLVLVLFSVSANAIETIRIIDHFVDENVGSRLESLSTYQDFTWTWQVEHMTEWHPNGYGYMKVGDPGKHYWSRVRLSNESGSFTLVMLELDSFMLNKIEVFLVDTRGRQLHKFWYTGMDLGVKSKPYPAGNFVFPIYMKQDESFDVYIKVINDTPAFVPVRLSHMGQYVSRATMAQNFSGVVYGIIFLASLFSLLMFGFIREKRFLYYALFCLCTLVLLLHLSGLIFMSGLLPGSVNTQKLYLCISNLFFVGLIFSFGDVFRQISMVRHFSKNNRLLIFFPLFMAVACWFIDVIYSVYANLFLMTLLFIVYMYMGFVIWKRCVLFQKLCLVSVLFFLVCWLTNLLVKFGLHYISFATDSVMFCFAALGSFSLSFALVYRTYVEKSSRIAAGIKNRSISQRFIDMYHQAAEGFFSADLDGRVLTANKAFFAMLGFRNLEDMCSSVGPYISAVHVNPMESNDLLSDLVLANQSGLKREIAMKRKDGSSFIVLMSLRIAERNEHFDPDRGDHVIEGIIIDISENKQIRTQIDYVLNHDSVTKLHNRTFMQHRLMQVKEEGDRNRGRSSSDFFLFIDIDHFKVINNSCGSLAGDTFLQMVGSSLHKLGIPDDCIARLGGDEFGVVLTDCFVDNVVLKAEEIRSAIQKLRFEWNHSFYSVTASIGIISCQSIDTSSILSLAETACGAAKIQGRNRVYLYSDLSDDVLNYKKEIGWIAQIYNAIEQHKFVLYKQHLKFNDAAGEEYLEIFVRLLGDNGNILPASTFIGAARKFGLITHIDSWVLESLMDWIGTQDLEHLGAVFINFSASTSCSQHMLRKMQRMFENATFDLHKLCFEISESTIRQNLKDMSDNMVELIRTHGCQLAIDHFEGGIGSYAIIDALQPEYVKLDCETVVMLHKTSGSSIINSILDKLHDSRRKIIAMHVRNRENYEIISQYKFDAYQGFSVDRPMPISLNPEQN